MSAEPRVNTPEIAPRIASPVTGQSSYIDVINSKRNIIRSHTKAVVNDAIAKTHNYMNQAMFDKAKNAVETAILTVNKNQMHLGDELFKTYNDMLAVLTEEISERESQNAKQREQEKRKGAARAQRQYIEQMELDREQRIDELMENALSFQKQQRYEAALGQLESLLALDPQNEEALVLKDTLEDTIFFRKQLEVQKESSKQRADVFLKTEESGIPYADELTYPKNWREIIARPTRRPEQPIGLNPLDVVVYEQLDQIVDLSDLSRDMTFREVIDRLRNSLPTPVQIQPNWKDLFDNADVDENTAAGMDPLTGITLRKAIEILLAGVTSAELGEVGELAYIVDEGVILIGTVDMLPRRFVNRVYDISDLVSQPANYGGIQGLMMAQMLSNISGTGGLTGALSLSGASVGGDGGSGIGGSGGSSGLGGGGLGGGGLGGGMSGGMGGMSGGMGGMGSMMGGMGGMGGMSGGMGGGGYGGGGMGGGMGGGGYGGGGMSSMMGGGGGRFLAEDLRYLIQETIEPDSWYDLSDTGEGTITPYPTQQPKKLAVMQIPEVHREIEKLLNSLRKSLGNQVAIEAVFLIVSENFLHDVGMDVDFSVNLGSHWGQLGFQQGSGEAVRPDASTKIQGSLGGLSAEGSVGIPAVITGGYGSILDDLQVSFLLRAVQAHTDSKSLTAPKGTVLSGESATFSVQDLITYALPPDTTTVTQGTGVGTAGTTTGTEQNIGVIPIGTSLSITPTITHDKKYVLLNIMTQLTDLLRLRTHDIEGPVGADGTVQEYTATVPETETSQVLTRVSVPDGGTLLIGGQKITSEVEKQAGVPVLSKIPIVGRLFRSNSKIRDHKVLLILVKPTIILQEESEAEAIAAMESEF
jgi:general secretion pathway protein D